MKTKKPRKPKKDNITGAKTIPKPLQNLDGALAAASNWLNPGNSTLSLPSASLGTFSSTISCSSSIFNGASLIGGDPLLEAGMDSEANVIGVEMPECGCDAGKPRVAGLLEKDLLRGGERGAFAAVEPGMMGVMENARRTECARWGF